AQGQRPGAALQGGAGVPMQQQIAALAEAAANPVRFAKDVTNALNNFTRTLNLSLQTYLQATDTGRADQHALAEALARNAQQAWQVFAAKTNQDAQSRLTSEQRIATLRNTVPGDLAPARPAPPLRIWTGDALRDTLNLLTGAADFITGYSLV